MLEHTIAEMPVFRTFPDFRKFCADGSVSKFKVKSKLLGYFHPFHNLLMILTGISEIVRVKENVNVVKLKPVTDSIDHDWNYESQIIM